ncbi:MAG: HAD family hydrolase [Pirellulaceae bacterium]
MNTKGIIFDVEDVFFDGTFFHRSLHQMIRRCGCKGEFREIQSCWQNKYLPQVYEGKLQYWDALASFFSSMGLARPQVTELIVSAQSRLKSAQDNLRLYPDVSEVISRIKKSGVALAIICNSIHAPETMCEMLQRINLRTNFDFVLTSYAAKRVMPDRNSFTAVCQAMGQEPSSVLYISTRSERLQMARECGLIPVQLNRHGSTSPTRSLASNQMIRTLNDLPHTINQLVNARLAV